MLIQTGIASSGVSMDMSPISNTALEFTRSIETLRMSMSNTNLSSQNEKFVNQLLKDLTISSYRLTDGVCIIADHSYYLTKDARNKRQIVTSVMLLLTTIGTFFSFIVPNMHQQIKPRQLTTIQRHLQTLDIRTSNIDNQL